MQAPEASIRELHASGHTHDAVTLAIETYGDEVYGFLASRLRDDDLAADAFAQACEDLYTSIVAFEWRCSMRTWIYKLAHSAAAREIRSAHRRVPLSQVSDVADRVASRTREYLRTQVKDGFTALRDELAPEDQTLLILRVDRDLDWNEVAEVLSGRELGADDQKRAAARLRQRFKTIKDQLRQRAIAVGLIPAEEP